MWKITVDNVNRDSEDFNRTGFVSPDYVEGTLLPFRFRMLDDDRNVCYYGNSDDCDSEAAFEPLDDLGEPDAGCTVIEYYNSMNGSWEAL